MLGNNTKQEFLKHCGLMTDLGLIHSTIYPIILLRHRKPFHFKTSKIYRQEFEKSLHYFKENCYKQG